MNALLNAHTKRGCDSPPHIGFASNVSPEAQSSQTGVSSEYVQQEGYNWFVLRATYNRVNAAVEKAKKNDIKTYVPMHYVLKVIAGKKKRIQQPLLPNFLFIYATREQSDSFVKKTVDAPISFINLKSATTRLYDTEAKIICIVSKKGAQCIECHHKDI